MSYSFRGFFLMLCLCGVFAASKARLPDDLPGQEITDEQYFQFMIPRDSIAAKVPATSPSSPTWLDSTSKTWDAPPIPVQIAEDRSELQMGMGALFVPRMSDAAREPEIEILMPDGTVVAHGRSGTIFSVVPGNYHVMLGSGSHKQRMVRSITVGENRTTPLIPDWSGLSINVVDDNNLPFRGEYELVRIDKFDPMGRGYGQDPTLGEEVRTWILRPGIYKILGVGQSYNTLTNFVTVRLLPGEFTNFLLIQDPTSLRIQGGGEVDPHQDRRIFSYWRYGVDIGGSMDLSSTNDRVDTINTTIDIAPALLARLSLRYDRTPFDWDTRLRVNESVRYSRRDASLESRTDDILLTSLFTWNVLSWMGPYGRFEGSTEIIPTYTRKPSTIDQHYFVAVDRDSFITAIDSHSVSRQLQPAFSPTTFEAGIGSNFNIINTRWLESRLLAGIGFTQENRLDEWALADTARSRGADDESYIRYVALKNNDKSFQEIRYLGSVVSRPEYGPEAALHALVRIGYFATGESQVKIFLPIERMRNPDFRPDFTFRGVLAWRLMSNITIDYQYEYLLRWPADITLHTERSRHSVWLRFSYTSR